MNLLKDIENFTDVLPIEQDESYYPTRQMLEYVLVKLLTFSKIMFRINVCTKQSAIFYMNRVKRGDTHWLCLMPYALLSRIWSISKLLLKHSVQWYTSLHKYVDKLEYKGVKYLLEHYVLPDDIKMWLGLDDLENTGRFQWSHKKYTDVDSTLISNDEDEMVNIIGFVSQLNEDKVNDGACDVPIVLTSNSKQKIEVTKPILVDQGEVVPRESYNVLHKFHNKMKYNKYNHNFESVVNSLALQEFIDKEEEFRNDNNNLSLTSHLSLMQWHALRKALINTSSIIGNKRKIQKKMQKIWKEKCLDYL